MDRLDEVVGPENWKDEYAPGPDGGVICGLSLRIEDEWITKWDGAENTDFEAIKGGLSDAFKRAGYKWGIGRYLYRLESLGALRAARQDHRPEIHPSSACLGAAQMRGSPAHRSRQAVSESHADLPSEREQQTPGRTRLWRTPVNDHCSYCSYLQGKRLKWLQRHNGTPSPATPTPNGQTHHFLERALVEAVLKAHLAANPAEAVRLLNESGLDATVTPEQAVAHFQSQLKR